MFVSVSKTVEYNTTEKSSGSNQNNEIKTNDNNDFLFNVDLVHIILLLYQQSNNSSMT